MQAPQDTTRRQPRDVSPLLGELSAIYDALDDTAVIKRLWQYRRTGRRGFTPRSLWRAVLAGFYLNIPSTIGLARRLQEDRELADLCGFVKLPSRITIGRFLRRLAAHSDLVQACLDSATSELAANLDGFGSEWAVDSTTMSTYANPNRSHPSDKDASWTRKNDPQGKLRWYYGYKLHVVCDANYELPVYMEVSPAGVSDTVTLLPLIEQATLRTGLRPTTLRTGLRPTSVAADRGYDSIGNVNGLLGLGIRPIIKRIDRSAAQGGHGTKVRKEGLARRAIDQDADDWSAIYSRRGSVERLFSRLKGHRALLRHTRRRIGPVALHCTLALLVTQAWAVGQVHAGRFGEVARLCP